MDTLYSFFTGTDTDTDINTNTELPSVKRIRESLELATSYLKQPIAKSAFDITNENTNVSYTSKSFYTTLETISNQPELNDDIRCIVLYWIQTKENVNASQSGYVIFTQNKKAIYVLKNDELYMSKQSYCQIVDLDMIQITEEVKKTEETDFLRYFFRSSVLSVGILYGFYYFVLKSSLS